MWLFKLALTVVGIYAVIVGIAYFLQTWLIFPASLVGGNVALPASALYQQIEIDDGGHVVLVRIPSKSESTEPKPLLLGFGGNAWNADAVALLLHRMFPEHEIAALHYRGYHPSGGRPSAQAIFDDARRVVDFLGDDLIEKPVAVGFSIGASVAVELAATRPLQGIVLVTPFDSLKELAAIHYPWLPVRWLIRHRMETAETLRDLEVPAAIITAGNDNVVPESRSSPVRDAAANLTSSSEIENAGHNDIYDTAEFAAALRDSVSAVIGE